MSTSPRPLGLIILDGWGLSEATTGNAIHAARTPNFDRLWSRSPSTTLCAHGPSVGLRPGLMGNSEVGHLNLGAGRVVWQGITRIDRSIEDRSFFEIDALRNAYQRGLDGGVVHLMGLLSDGGVHSDTRHYQALLELAGEMKLPPDAVHVHAMTDGRDTGPKTGYRYVQNLLQTLDDIGVGRLATLCGRYYSMDRDHRWERTRKAFELYISSTGTPHEDPLAAIEACYQDGVTDEFIEPITLPAGRKRPIQEGDSIVWFNFRADRARQLTEAFTKSSFQGFPRDLPRNLEVTTLTSYRDDFDLPVCFAPTFLPNGLGKWFSHHNRNQLRIAETEKYAHVTYFFNGGVETPLPQEERILVPSPDVPTYDLHPAMSAPEITHKLLHALESEKHDFFLINFANPDMVGHTGNLEAAVKAVEVVDHHLGEILECLRSKNGTALVTADHGNAETMIASDGSPHTAHTTNPVPCILFEGPSGIHLKKGLALESIAPTLLDLSGLPHPPEMTGPSLLI